MSVLEQQQIDQALAAMPGWAVRDGMLRELRVDGELHWIEADPPPALDAYFARLGLLPPEGAVTEVNLALEPWVAQLAGRLERHGGGLVSLL